MNVIASSAPALFRPDGVIMLADVRALAALRLNGNERRDVLSAFNVLRTRAGVDLDSTPASAPAVRELFGALHASSLGVSAKRYANIRSLVVCAVDRFGMKRTRITARVPLNPAWVALLDNAGNKAYAQGIKRLAHYASALGIPPQDVRSEHLLGLHDALEAECMTKHPRKVIKHTIAMWNHFGRTVPGWPATVLASPFVTEPDTLPLECFPPSFAEDIARWSMRMQAADPLDSEAPIRPLRPATIAGYIVHFRRFASALVRRKIVPLEAITGLSVFFEEQRVNKGLRHFLPAGVRAGDPRTDTAFRIARTLGKVGRHYLKLDEKRLAEIDVLCRRLDPKPPRVMGRRSRDRLEQFDDPENVAKLLGFPEAEAVRALRKTNPLRRARGMERALAVALLIFTGLRITNLRHIRHATDIRRARDGAVLSVEASQVKNGQALAFDLPPETLVLLDRFLAEHRPQLPGHEGPFLFPGKDGGPKSDNAMREAVSASVRKHCGLVMNPHLYRHAVAKIVVERDPAMAAAMARHLGHRSMLTTFGSYIGAESRTASRRLNALLADAREDANVFGA